MPEPATRQAGPEARILREYRTVAVVGISSDEGRPSYRQEAAEDAWPRCVAWFERHLT